MGQIEEILDRIALGQQSAADLDALREALRGSQVTLASGDAAVAAGEISESVVVTGEGHAVQVGKYHVPIDKVEKLELGDRYYGADAERIAAVMRELVDELRQERGNQAAPRRDVMSPDDALKVVETVFGRSLDDEERRAALAFGKAVGFKRQALERAAARVAGGGAWPPLQNGELTPYVGLRTFQEQDAPLFYGRDRLVEELLAKVESWPFLAVLGPSGSGKSSVVRAGLIPRLKGGSAQGSERWLISVFKPGSRPLDALAVALTRLQGGEQLGGVLKLRRSLATDERALLLASDLMRGDDPQRRLLLVVDQFEELWTLAPADEEARQRFVTEERDALLKQLLTVVQAPDSPSKVVVIMRADFQHRTLEQPALASVIDQHLKRVYPMSRTELAQAIQEPAWEAGADLDPGLADELINSVEGEEGALPLLEYTLEQLWKARSGEGVMTWAAYRNLGGVEGALAARASAILAEHYRLPEQREALRHALLRLIQPGAGTMDTRRRTSMDDLVPAGETREDVQALLQPLVDERLLTTGRDEASGVESVEVSHEALIRAWPALRDWIAESREDLRFGLQMEEAAREWVRRSQSPDYLWSGLRLANAVAWLQRAQPLLTAVEQRFLEASQAAEEEERQVAEQHRALELELAHEQAQRAEERAAVEARRARTLRLVAVLLGLLLIPSVVFGLKQLQRSLSPWQRVTGFPEAAVQSLATSPSGSTGQAPTFCAGTVDIGLACSDGGERWNIQQEFFPLGTPGKISAAMPGDVRAIVDVAYDPTDDRRLVISARDHGILRSDDAGNTWINPSLTPLTSTLTGLVMRGDVLLALSGRPAACTGSTQLLGSRDGGATWQVLNTPDSGLPAGIYATSLAADAQRVYVGGAGGLYSSPLTPPWRWTNELVLDNGCALAADPVDPNALYLAEYQGKAGRLLHVRPAQSSQVVTELSHRPIAIAPNPDPAGDPVAFVLLSHSDFMWEVVAVASNGSQESLGNRPGWAFLTPSFDLMAARRPDNAGIWLWIAHSDGLLCYDCLQEPQRTSQD